MICPMIELIKSSGKKYKSCATKKLLIGRMLFLNMCMGSKLSHSILKLNMIRNESLYKLGMRKLTI